MTAYADDSTGTSVILGLQIPHNTVISAMDKEIKQLQVISNVITQYLINNGLQILVTFIILIAGYLIA